MNPLRIALGAAALFCVSLTHAQAEDASPWVGDAHSAVRLLAGSRSGAVLLGGIAIRMDHGWKTYWRTPGDSGVPPRFDFSKSDNVEAVTVLWPAPKKFPDGAGGIALGYKDQVVLPLRIIARSADKPVTLRADINYAICDKLCVPVEATPELEFVSVASTEDSALSAALDTVPKPADIGDPNPLTILDVRRDGPKTVLIDVAAPEHAPVEVFVEGPEPDWALPVPEPVKHSPPGIRRFSFQLDGLPSGASADGAALRLTLVSGDHAYEFNTNLEAVPATESAKAGTPAK